MIYRKIWHIYYQIDRLIKLHISLTPEQQKELEQVFNRHPKAYMREKASAILKVAQGQSGVAVAQQGLLRKRRKNTVYDWVHRYESEGLQGLLVRKGRGVKPAFSPVPESEICLKMQTIVSQRPQVLWFGAESLDFKESAVRLSWLLADQKPIRLMELAE